MQKSQLDTVPCGSMQTLNFCSLVSSAPWLLPSLVIPPPPPLLPRVPVAAPLPTVLTPFVPPPEGGDLWEIFCGWMWLCSGVLWFESFVVEFCIFSIFCKYHFKMYMIPLNGLLNYLIYCTIQATYFTDKSPFQPIDCWHVKIGYQSKGQKCSKNSFQTWVTEFCPWMNWSKPCKPMEQEISCIGLD